MKKRELTEIQAWEFLIRRFSGKKLNDYNMLGICYAISRLCDRGKISHLTSVVMYGHLYENRVLDRRNGLANYFFPLGYRHSHKRRELMKTIIKQLKQK